jgi:hypothetical protein
MVHWVGTPMSRDIFGYQNEGGATDIYSSTE